MQSCPIDCLMLDFGGVLAEEGFTAGLMAIARSAGRDAHETWQAGLQAVWDSGYIVGRADEAGFWRLFKERTGIEGDAGLWREDILRQFAVRPWMVALTQAFKARGAVTAILSDQTDWLDRLNDGQDFFKYFDKVFNSYYWGRTKKEPAFFLEALQCLKVRPERCLFVDDNAGNVGRALELGIVGVHYQDRAGFEQDLARICPAVLAG